MSRKDIRRRKENQVSGEIQDRVHIPYYFNIIFIIFFLIFKGHISQPEMGENWEFIWKTQAGFDRKEEQETGRRRKMRDEGPQEGTGVREKKLHLCPLALYIKTQPQF